jgi:branched-chain amino acid transport system substrate-binding protein
MPRLSSITALVASVTLGVVSLTACSPSSSANPVQGDAVIGAPLALSGASASIGLDIQRGAEVALDELNKNGGLNGHRVSLRAQDTAADPAQAVQVATSFARDPQVVAVLGPIGAAEVGAVTSLAQSQKIPMIAPASAGAVPGVKDGHFNDWTFRVNQAIPLVVGPQMDAVLKKTGAKKVTILHFDDNAAYVDTAERWEKAAMAAGAKVTRMKFPSTTQDYSALVTSIPKDSDLIAIAALPATDAPLIRSIRQAGITGQLMGEGSLLTSEVFEGSRGGTQGAFAYSAFLAGQSETAKKFSQKFQEKFKTEPSAFNAYAYDAVMMLASAAGKGDLSRQGLRDGLSKLVDFHGASGVISYNRSGDAIRSGVPLVQIGSKGSLSKVSDITPAQSY